MEILLILIPLAILSFITFLILDNKVYSIKQKERDKLVEIDNQLGKLLSILKHRYKKYSKLVNITHTLLLITYCITSITLYEILRYIYNN